MAMKLSVASAFCLLSLGASSRGPHASEVSMGAQPRPEDLGTPPRFLSRMHTAIKRGARALGASERGVGKVADPKGKHARPALRQAEEALFSGDRAELRAGTLLTDSIPTTMTTTVTTCNNKNGTVEITVPCMCGTHECTGPSNPNWKWYCDESRDPLDYRCAKQPTCKDQQGKNENSGDCRCGTNNATRCKSTSDAHYEKYCDKRNGLAKCNRHPTCKNQDGTKKNIKNMYKSHTHLSKCVCGHKKPYAICSHQKKYCHVNKSGASKCKNRSR